MSKVFLYLYPISEYMYRFLPYDIDEHEKCLKELNEAIDKRYRKNGYDIVYAMYPDKKIFGVEPKSIDKIINVDIPFSKFTKEHEYPNEISLLGKIGNPDELIVGGFHVFDCVKKVAEAAFNMGINTLVDAELTDLFFNLHTKDYFDSSTYDPYKFKNYMINSKGPQYRELMERIFNQNYDNPVYGFNFENEKKH